MYVRESLSSYTTQELQQRLRPFTVALRDGREVRIGPLGADDHTRVAAMLARMEVPQLYHRSGGRVRRLTPADADYLTTPDRGAGHGRMAWCAQEIGGADPRIVAVSQFLLDRTTGTAETAVAVEPDFRSVGLATILMETLLLSAYNAGVERLIAFVEPENRAARLLFRRLGATRRSLVDNVFVTEIPVNSEQRSWSSSSASLRQLVS